MVFKNNIPQPTDNLAKQSQQDLLGNMSQLDTSFLVDHYTFSDLTANNGKHNKVTTPGFVTIPPSVPVVEPTTTTDPIFYGFEPLDAGGAPTTSLGLLQYSRGINNAVPTPVTELHSPVTPLSFTSPATLTILDFTGIPRAFCTLYAMNTSAPLAFSETLIVWTGTVFIITRIDGTSGELIAINTGNILKLSNNNVTPTNSVFWTLRMHRLS